MTTERLEPSLKTAVNRIAYDLTRPVVTAMSIRLRARAQELTDQGLEPARVIEIISQEAMRKLVRESIGSSRRHRIEMPARQTSST